MPKATKDKHITRANHVGSAGGYMVRFFRKGKTYQAYFSDLKYSTQKKALAAAREHRDEMIAKFRLMTPVERAKVIPAHNTSGTVGVRLSDKIVIKGKKKYKFTSAIATWTVAGERKTRAFSVDRYGQEEAWNLALKARAAGLRQMAKAAKAD